MQLIYFQKQGEFVLKNAIILNFGSVVQYFVQLFQHK